MRLVVVTNDYLPRPGGIQQYLAGLLGAYPAPVRVLAPADDAAETPPHIEVVRSPRQFMWPSPEVASWALERAREWEPDAILFGAPTPLPWIGPGLRTALGVPYGVLSHGAEVTIPAMIPVARQLLLRPMRQADVLFSNGRFTARTVSRMTRRPVTVLGGGVDLDEFHPRSTPAESGSLPVVGCVSRFVPRKGQHRLLEAAALLRDRGRPVAVLLVGKGRMEAALRDQAAELGIPVRFEVDVPWAALGGLYREMDIFCMPCRDRWGGLEVEGLGLVFLEAGASGLPVLAGDSGGSSETVDPGRTGFVVRSVDDIVEAVEMLLSDPDRSRRMGQAARRFVVQNATWPLAADRLLAGFRRTAGVSVV